MAQENRSVGRGPAAEGSPVPEPIEVPEADAVDQSTPAVDDAENGWDHPSEDSLHRASEADVVEQALEVELDEDEWR